ncbi:MAG TPA: putative baseplate assembly protein [Chloroflexota bacterium]|jgi:predicted phage baseplate assembly protein
MPLPLPDLDTRQWADLVDEGRSLIPRYAPTWTDHNVHDPGITLVELLAWLVELDIYRLNQIPQTHQRKFLALVNMPPLPARAARTWTGLAPGQAKTLPAGTQFVGVASNSARVLLGSASTTTCVPVVLRSVLTQAQSDQLPTDQTSTLQAGASFAPLGPNPAPGAALWLAFDKPLPTDAALHLALTFDGVRSGADERARIGAEPGFSTDQHHSARLQWEASAGSDTWLPLDAGAGQVTDRTRAFTLDGGVELRVPQVMGAVTVGSDQRYVIRARLASGAFDSTPMVSSIIVNAVPLAQSAPPVTILGIRPHATVTGTPVSGPTEQALKLALDSQGQVTALEFLSEADAPTLPVVAYVPPGDTASGALVLEAALLGYSSGLPGQTLPLPAGALADDAIDVFTIVADALTTWRGRPDFDASTPADAHFVVETNAPNIMFGDGNHGRIPESGAPVLARFAVTLGAAGNLPARTPLVLAPSLQNWARLAYADLQQHVAAGGIGVLGGDTAATWSSANPDGYTLAAAHLGGPSTPIAVTGGQDAEPFGHAVGRAVSALEAPTRAIAAADYETLALATPGTAIARTRTLPGTYTPYPCFTAPGVVSLIVVPDQTSAQPLPSAGLLASVQRYVGRRRMLGTHLEVVAPDYTQIAVTSTVQARRGVDAQALQAAVVAALTAFFDPLAGGLAGTGWPFGRPVYRAEVLQVIDQIAGVDAILALELVVDGQAPQCGNVCIGPTQLTVSGQHKIQVSPAV